MRRLALLASLSIMMGCQTNPQQTEDPPIWGRFDCQRQADNPALMSEFEQARIICTGRAEAQARAAAASVAPGYGMGGAIAAGFERSVVAQQVGVPAVMSCMAERGYTRAPRAAHEARCAAVPSTPRR